MPESDIEQARQEGEAPETPASPKTETARENLPRRESRAFRQQLLSRLPTLAVPKWEQTETLDVYQDLQGIVDLDADAFLEPLEPIAEGRHD